MKSVYERLAEEARALLRADERAVTTLSNAAALIFNTLSDVNWAGFYLAGDGDLILGPFQGKPACVKIPFGRGVCGTCAATGKTVLVENVHLFPGHIACDSASNSEIVVPVWDEGGRLAAVLDLDSASLSRFAREDARGLEAFCALLREPAGRFHALTGGD